MKVISCYLAVICISVVQALECQPDETAVFVVTADHSASELVRTISGTTLADCTHGYIASLNAATGPKCAGFNFNDDGTCQYYEIDLSMAPLILSAGSNLHKKFCIRENIPCVAGFEQQSSKIIKDSAAEILRGLVKADCLTSCLDSEYIFGFQCLSVLYFPEKQECVLNSAKAGAGSPALREVQENVAYIEPKCDGDNSEWSAWGLCREWRQTRTRQCSTPGTCLGRHIDEKGCTGLSTTLIKTPTTVTAVVVTTTSRPTISPTSTMAPQMCLN